MPGGITVTVTVEESEQLNPLVPITVYIVVAVGATLMIDVVSPVGIHKYVLPPEAVSVAVSR
jgi:hypothetical protein